MTSKRLFFNVMREDLRHKTWMIVLAFLGNFMAFPIAWLLFKNNLSLSNTTLSLDNVVSINNMVSLDNMASGDNMLPLAAKLPLIMNFFCDTATYLGGIVALVGALIVGLFSFRYLFHKNMVDTWHSMPIKRSTLYAAGYVEGFLVWFVPFLINLLPTTLMAGSLVYKIGGMQALSALLKEILLTFVTLIAAYLLVYHLTLMTVMFCGNIMNALVSIVILGFGVISIFVVGIGFCSYYLDTFSDFSYSFEIPSYASPLFSALYLLYSRANAASASYTAVNIGGVSKGIIMRVGFAALSRQLLINLGVAAVLGLCAWILYQKRKSELAEQGIKIKAAATLLRIFAGVAAGMGGWMLFILLNENMMSLSWAIFGTVLGSVLIFGVLNIIFEMDSKGFFAHKIQMGITVCLALLIGMSIHGDWFGYDAYLPDKDEIAGIAINDPYFKSHSFYRDGYESYFECMEFSDAEVIYAYLEQMSKHQYKEPELDYDSVMVKVKLKNNKGYYRKYRVYAEDKDLLWPILTSEEYLQTAYAISEEEMTGIRARLVGRPGNYINLESYGQAEIIPIVKAYNQDVLADPEGTLIGRGTLLAYMDLYIADNTKPQGYYMSARLDIYDTMENTLEALKQAGCEEVVALTEVSDISSVELLLWAEADKDVTPQTAMEQARQYYGVYGQNQGIEQEGKEASAAVEYAAGTSGMRKRMQVSVTDREEIEELFSLMSFLRPNPIGSVFGKEWVQIAIVVDNNEHYCYIPYGTLPEKYILRFGEL